MYRFGFVGAGNMATAIFGGILSSGILSPEKICLFDISEEKRNAFAEKGASPLGSCAEVMAQSEVILLAVKPQNMEKVLTEMAPHYTPDKIIVSIAAGISAAYIRRLIGCETAKIVLVMPNTPMLIGYGAVAMSHDDSVTAEEFRFVRDVFSSAAEVEEIPAHLMNEIIPVNGSSPAFIYLFAKLVSEYSDKLGIPYETASRLFCHTLIGSAQMMLQTDKTHQQLINMVTSPGGTTFAMLDALKECDFAHAVDESFDRCIKRAYELGK